VAHDLGPAEALQRLSKVVLAQGHPERFLTAACARLTCRDDGTGDLVLARGGHPTPLLVRADGTPVALAPAGSLLGAVADIRLDTVQEQIRPGDFLVLVTDGITEARAGTDLFGEERLATTLGEAVARRRAHGIPDGAAGGTAADWLADLVLEAVDHFRDGPAEDDVAILVAHVREAP
jgi:serine phosphatase RsbU (regulator of sigma subunit)